MQQANQNNETINIDIIANKEFKVSARGYDQDEVDNFLDSVIEEMERREQAMTQLQQQCRELQAQLSRGGQTAAQQTAGQTTEQLQQRLKEAQAEIARLKQQNTAAASAANDQSQSALGILSMAQRVQEETIAEAKAKAEEILTEAQHKADSQLADLSSARDKLTEQVNTLKQTISDYRTRFETLLQAQQEAMDKLADL